MSGNQMSIERLKGRENFASWRVGAKAHLTCKGLFKEITVDVAALTDTKSKEANEKALAELTLLLDPCMYNYIEDCKTFGEAWNALIGAFEDKGAVRKIGTLGSWFTLKLQDCESMEDYVSKHLNLRSKVKAAGFNIEEEVAASIMLVGLPEEYKPMVMSIRVKSGDLTVDYVKNLLLQDVDYGNDGGNQTALMARKTFKKNKKVKCYDCKGPHYRNKCPQRMKKDGNEKSSDKRDVVLYSSFIAQDTKSCDWFIDSGATAHMTRHETILQNKCRPKISEVRVANDEKLTISGVGDVKQLIKVENQKSAITLKEVQYIPGICANLISVSQIVNKGNEVLFNKNGCKIFDSNKNIIATGSMVNNMFKLDVVENEVACTVRPKNISDDLFNLWHRRLGHACVSKLNLVLGTSVQAKDFKCVTCMEGKQVRKPFISDGNRAKDLLELIHSDVCGPITPQSIGGAKYFVIFVDDYSRKVFAYVMKAKSEVFSKFIVFKNFAEKQLGKPIKKFRSDGGGEFDNKQMQDFFAQQRKKALRTHLNRMV